MNMVFSKKKHSIISSKIQKIQKIIKTSIIGHEVNSQHSLLIGFERRRICTRL